MNALSYLFTNTRLHWDDNNAIIYVAVLKHWLPPVMSLS